MNHKNKLSKKGKEWFSPKKLQKQLYLISVCLGALSYYYLGNAWHGIAIGLGLILTNRLRVDYP